MDFTFSQEDLSVQSAIADFAQKEIAPHAANWDENKTFPIDTLRHAAQLGVASLYIKDDIGGANLSRVTTALVFETIATACVSTAAYLSIHNMVGWIIDSFGSQTQRERWLPGMISMDLLGSYCLTEPDSGSDAGSLKTAAVREGDYYHINGSKSFISGGSTSDLYIVMVRTGDASTNGVSCIVVEKDTPGLSFGAKEKKLGWNNQATTMVFFEDCKVPVSHLLGQEGDGFKIAMRGLNGGRINIGACALGGAKACLQEAKAHMQTRTQFKKKLQDFQALRFKLADMLTHYEAARLMIFRAANDLDINAEKASIHCAMAKRMATDVGFSISNDALQIFGGYGYLKDYPIERFFRDLRVLQILEGTNEVMRLVIARHFFDDDWEQ